MIKILKNGRVLILILAVIFSITAIYFNGISTSLDLEGGTLVTLELERAVTADVMQDTVTRLELRLNRLGISDVNVRPWGDSNIMVEVSGTSAEKEASVIKILQEQGVYEARIDGVVAVRGSDIVRVDAPEIVQSRYQPVTEWKVPFTITREAGQNFANVAKGKGGYPVDMFLDRPANSVIVMNNSIYSSLTVSPLDFNISGLDAEVTIPQIVDPFPIEKRVGNDIKLLAYTNKADIPNLLKSYVGTKERVIILADENEIGRDIFNQIRDMGFKTERETRAENEGDYAYFTRVVGLMSSPRLSEDLATGEASATPAYVITGTSETPPEAAKETSSLKIILQSGALPVATNIAGKSFISPTLGSEFIRQVLIAGLAALLAVAAIVFIRYRKIYIALPILLISFSEVIIILGVASVIHWTIDLAAMAGIIAAIGTGVDHQIVITDESIMEKGGEKRKRKSIKKRVEHAFFIIFTSAFTTIGAMAPLAYLSLGMLRGFAVTTIIGLLIGITITRPAYGNIAKIILKNQ
ncbi:MAG: Protein-export membrane protein SecD [Candidatus Methanofastidiosum methylothiophilum]|uniref:Protein-export membrane protein SecD n=1 Tax=Candidatus Methanofastidiosum methylothiophilum TaxID=1705564 RepID=A0A150J0X9_9EURY|nr:MAG: Protein-export membrane protein SecD [Candidatus Methanofastidiosum methylthiophilus]KYC48243.1 MAG: Protein-export membrane protein SecD [Candidatus Methanofastidiosum methylthiophilus]KYC50900.1 MAG: Protein-export membrane protein SecD [Candidatus Methanofastidiosum methylthiophilus]